MSTKKVTVTIPEEILAEASEIAKEAGLPFSTWLAQTAAHQVRIHRGLEAMREWDEEVGPPSPDAEVWVDEQLAKLETPQRKVG